MDLASGPISLGSYLRTQFSWVQRQDPKFLGFRFLNIIICVINIVIFIIIKSINIKKYFFFIIINNINIKNIIICIVNIIICIMINIIYKIIKNFEIFFINIEKQP